MKTMIITINVEEVIEGNKKYFLATSPDMDGFMAETETYEEIKDLAPQLIIDMLMAQEQRRIAKEKKLTIQNTSLNFNFLTSSKKTIPLYA